MPKKKQPNAEPIKGDAPPSNTSNDSSHTIKLKEVTTIADVSELQKQWLELLSGPAVIIDASAVERIDTASLQLICSLYKAAKSKQIDINTLESSQAMDDAIKLLGLNNIIKIH